MSGMTSDSSTTVHGHFVSALLPEGWTQLEPDNLMGSQSQGNGSAIDCIAAQTQNSGGGVYAPNLVITVASVPNDLGDLEWRDTTTHALLNEIPGFVLLDLSEVATQKWKGFARLGCYILDDESITIRQFTWLDPDQPRGYTATLSCATRDYGAHYELFENVGASLEAMPAAPTDHSREG